MNSAKVVFPFMGPKAHLAWSSVAGLMLLVCATCAGRAQKDIRWLIEYNADGPPNPKEWTRLGEAGSVTVEDGVLHLVDDTEEGSCSFKATWQPSADQELVIEARVRVESATGPGSKSIGRLRPVWHGAPVGIRVGDGQREEGLVLWVNRISTFLDRFHMMNTTDDFHLYRIIVSGDDISIYVDGELKIRGKDAFRQPTDEDTPFIEFGSMAKSCTSKAQWDFIRAGVRQQQVEQEEKLRITVSEPWRIQPEGIPRATRPYMYNVGDGILLMSVAQGPDAIHEPYGVLKSTDMGKTWAPIKRLQDKTFAPLPMIRLASGSIFGASRWTVKYEVERLWKHGSYVGISWDMGTDAESLEMYESRIWMPDEIVEKSGHTLVFERDIWERDGDLLAVTYDRNAGYLLRSSDRGHTWKYVSTIGRRHEPAVAFLSDTQAVAILRQGSARPLHQVRSFDGGRTWSEPVVLEEGSVCPDIVHMSNDVLACSYGRPGCNIMFSNNGGESWDYHRVITKEPGFNYTAIQEVAPGRLLYVHDAPPLTAVYVDVEVVK